MKKIVMSVCCGFLLLSISSAFAKPILNIKHWTLKNGAQVYFVKAKEIPMLDVRVVFKAGSAYDGKHYGLASLTGALIGQGTAIYDANQIANGFAQVGAQYSSAVSRDKAIFGLRTLTKPKYIKPALALFANILDKPSFSSNAIKRKKNYMLMAIKASQQKPSGIAQQAFYHALYQNQPYGHSVLGKPKTITALNRAEIVGFYKRYYVTKNADIILVGAVTVEQARAIAQQITASLATGEPANTLSQSVSRVAKKALHINFPSKATSIIMGQVGINRNNPDYFPLILGNYVLGGLPDTSILYEELREKKGWTYFVYSQFLPLAYRGPFLIRMQTKNQYTQSAIKLLEKSLHQFMREGPSKQQLTAVKENVIGRFPLGLASNRNIVNVLVTMAFYNLPIDYLDTYQKRIQAVTAEQIKKAFSKFINTPQFLTVTVGPRKKKYEHT